jgi:DNA topoisomerase-1
MPRLRRSRTGSPGLSRKRSGTGFSYLAENGATITDASVRTRIEKLAIPPAWVDVWIAPDPLGHIQAIGTDAASRRQYIYHPQWRTRRDRYKFERALALAAVLPAARSVVTRDLRADGDPQSRSLAAAFRLLDSASPRVGGKRYLDQNGSHGLSTLLCSHATIHGDDEIEIRFRGKGGLPWEALLHDADLATVIRSLKRRGPKARLLAYKDGDVWHAVSATDINDYVRERTHGDFTAKDFRTLRGTIVAAQSLRDSAKGESTPSITAQKKAVVQAMKDAAATLGNTPTIAKKSYVDPRVVEKYLAGEYIAPSSSAPEAALRALLGAETGADVAGIAGTSTP